MMTERELVKFDDHEHDMLLSSCLSSVQFGDVSPAVLHRSYIRPDNPLRHRFDWSYGRIEDCKECFDDHDRLYHCSYCYRRVQCDCRWIYGGKSQSPDCPECFPYSLSGLIHKTGPFADCIEDTCYCPALVRYTTDHGRNGIPDWQKRWAQMPVYQIAVFGFTVDNLFQELK